MAYETSRHNYVPVYVSYLKDFVYYESSTISDQKKVKGKLYYLVNFKDIDKSLWLDKGYLKNCSSLMKSFYAEMENKSNSKGTPGVSSTVTTTSTVSTTSSSMMSALGLEPTAVNDTDFEIEIAADQMERPLKKIKVEKVLENRRQHQKQQHHQQRQSAGGSNVASQATPVVALRLSTNIQFDGEASTSSDNSWQKDDSNKAQQKASNMSKMIRNFAIESGYTTPGEHFLSLILCN